jgi:hypothetical protein
LLLFDLAYGPLLFAAELDEERVGFGDVAFASVDADGLSVDALLLVVVELSLAVFVGHVYVDACAGEKVPGRSQRVEVRRQKWEGTEGREGWTAGGWAGRGSQQAEVGGWRGVDHEKHEKTRKGGLDGWWLGRSRSSEAAILAKAPMSYFLKPEECAAADPRHRSQADFWAGQGTCSY